MLEKSYLCGINNNEAAAVRRAAIGCDLLEKSYLCGINNNLEGTETELEPGCDLLEKSYLCGINNNTYTSSHREHQVVICLKSLTFVVSITTEIDGHDLDLTL